ncbi:hypothetical protein FA13DRAFT_1796115 [Coprinellus micaceus]|uniref:Uncharacterized protein n=1 Tax=Coprinellus micaceus TaxID=71717 RepID=A0A4Y7SVA8_COPMI|nr:hypothetical protein FA13DRAFT_1796115 [Coprinellus micaceus]
MKSISVLTLLAFLALRAAAAPTDPPPAEGEVPVLRCANANRDLCPSGYTCCGPLHPQEGGIPTTKMKYFMIATTLLLSALGALSAPTADVPCAGPEHEGPRCPEGQTCCFSNNPAFPNGVCRLLDPDQVCAF